MKLIKSFRISLLILLVAITHSDKILNDYGNGNKGLGVNDKVKGVNNTWVGDNNTINGHVNTVIGHQNKIDGSNNIVEGSNNVIGDVSPQQIQRLQNQMFASFQDRFKGFFNFNPLPQKKPQPLPLQGNTNKTLQITQVVPENSSQKQHINNIANSTTSQTIQDHHDSNPKHEELQISREVSQHKIEVIVQKETTQQQVEQNKSFLLFRSYGSQYANSDHEEIYYLQDEMEEANNQLCKRWNYCLLDNRSMRWSFSSIYPTFPLKIEL